MVGLSAVNVHAAVTTLFAANGVHDLPLELTADLVLSSYSVLPAMSLDGVLHVHVQDHSYRSSEFREFVNQLLDNMNTYPQKNSVVVMDNASIHKSQELQDMVEAR